MLALLRRYRELILVSVLLLVPLGVFFANARKPSERTRLDRAVLWLTTPGTRILPAGSFTSCQTFHSCS